MRLFDRLTNPAFWMTIVAFLSLIPAFAPVGDWLGGSVEALVSFFTALSAILGGLGVLRLHERNRAILRHVGEDAADEFDASYYG